MNIFLKLIAVSVSVFVATNLDSLIILIFFFSRVNASFRPKHIILGQYLGFSTLLLLSLPGFFGGLVISKAWIGLLGLLPIFLGLKMLFSASGDPEDDDINTQAVSPFFQHRIFRHVNPNVFKVMVVEIVNGGDNISIYLSFFASLKIYSLLLVIFIFYLLLTFLCVVAYFFTRHPSVTHLISRYGHRVIPYLYIALGLYIIAESYL